MGSVSRASRCERFIEEFGEDYKKKIGIEAPFVRNQSLGEGPNEVIQYFFAIEFPGGGVL